MRNVHACGGLLVVSSATYTVLFHVLPAHTWRRPLRSRISLAASPPVCAAIVTKIEFFFLALGLQETYGIGAFVGMMTSCGVLAIILVRREAGCGVDGS